MHSAPHLQNTVFLRSSFSSIPFKSAWIPEGLLRDCVAKFTSVINIPGVVMDENVAYQAFMSETKDVLNKWNPQLFNLPATMETAHVALHPGFLSLHENEEIKKLIIYSVALLFWLY